jgi:hypothetical protein
MTLDKAGFRCPDCSFFLKRETVAKILTDPTHVAVRFMSQDEKNILSKGLENIGIVAKELLK